MYHELTVWSRGIIMDKEARDVSSCIAAAARKAGYYTENVSDYIDDPDRTNCLVRRYARFGDQPILDRFIYENPHPDWVVLIEETIIKAVNFLRGTRDGEGVLVVNSARDPEYLLKFLPGHDAGQARQAGRGRRRRPGRAARRQPVDVRPQPVRAGLRPDVHGRRRGAAGDRPGRGRAGYRRAGRDDRHASPLDDVAAVVADRDAMYRGAEQYRVLELSPAQTAG